MGGGHLAASLLRGEKPTLSKSGSHRQLPQPRARRETLLRVGVLIMRGSCVNFPQRNKNAGVVCRHELLSLIIDNSITSQRLCRDSS